MLRSEHVEHVSFYCGSDGIRKVLERIGDASILQIIEKEEKDEPEENKEMINSSQKVKYLKKELGDRYNPEFDSQEIDTLNYNEAVEKASEMYDKLVLLKKYRKSNRKEEILIAQNLKMMEISNKFTRDLQNPNETAIELEFQTAIAETEKKMMIKKMLKQRLRRNIYIKAHDTVLDPGHKKYTVFIIYTLGEDNQQHAHKVVESLGGRLYDCNSNREERMAQLEKRSDEIKRICKTIDTQISIILNKIEKSLNSIIYSLHKEKEIFKTMSKLESIDNGQCYTGEGWVLGRDLEQLNRLKSFKNDEGRFVFEVTKSDSIHPTHFKPSKFSQSFQDLTNVFGVPKYRELNPAVFMIFTFPFLFGAMFGDIFHGLILLVLSLLMITFYDKINGKCGVFQIILQGRFVVFTCSLSAIWFGFLYGDFASLPVSLFKSQYEVGRTYPFGIDPIWHHADNKMVFINSMKMKLSLIIGFFHMGLGSLISIYNTSYFKNKIDLICTAIPQAIAFFAFLGYLVFLCVYKWIVTIDRPSIVNTLISMYTDPFNIKDQMYPGQMYVQLLVFSFILMTIPWMIFSKPIYMILMKRVSSDGMLDLWINSGIHTVEFCLGLISNTSSYLRLWAVSLAHVQLTSVLHEFTIGSSNLILKFLTLPIYLFGTFMLLIGLEGLSACLHALRLNWIEFFSKFYSGGGQEFKPMNFKVPEEEE